MVFNTRIFRSTLPAIAARISEFGFGDNKLVALSEHPLYSSTSCGRLALRMPPAETRLVCCPRTVAACLPAGICHVAGVIVSVFCRCSATP